jgi:hypothetical protein
MQGGRRVNSRIITERGIIIAPRLYGPKRSITILLSFIFLGSAYIGFKSLFPSMVETNALAFRWTVGHDADYLGACTHVCLFRSPCRTRPLQAVLFWSPKARDK